MEAKIYTQEGKEKGTLRLPEGVFGLSWNADLVHQIAVSMSSNKRGTVAHAKGRRDVRGGGRKPWRQKGTGRARHGSRRSPIWRGGGVTFGPSNERNFSKKINKKMRQKAFLTILSEKFRSGEVLFVDELKLNEIKTRLAKEVLAGLGGVPNCKDLATRRKNTACIALLEPDPVIFKSFSNFGNVYVADIRNINVLDILQYKYLIIVRPRESVGILEKKRFAKEVKTAETPAASAKRARKANKKEPTAAKKPTRTARKTKTT